MSARSKCLGTVALAACLAAACAVGPDFHAPAPPGVNHYAYGADPETTEVAGNVAQHFSAGAPAAADWWRLFRSPGIDAVVARALEANPGLAAARARLRASQNSLRSGYGIFYPGIDAGAGASRERYAPANIGENLSGSVFNLFTLSSSVSWALDIFGGQRRMVEGLQAQVDLSRANEQAAFLALTTNVVNTLIAAAAYRAEVRATRELIDLQREQVRLAEVQAAAGTVPYATVLSLRAQMASNEAQVPQLEQKEAQADDLLAALVGSAPAEWRAPPIDLPDIALPVELPSSLPSDLVRQRPDIIAAEAQAHAASAAIGVATAALLPEVTLSGSFEGLSNRASTLFPAGGKAWNAGASVSAPLFAGGALWYRRKAAFDAYAAALADYRQTVLGAFEQVADVLQALGHDARTLRAQDDAQRAADEALRLVQANYAAGIANYLDVLNADAQDHQARLADIQAVAVRHQDTVALFAALGGGWWNR